MTHDIAKLPQWAQKLLKEVDRMRMNIADRTTRVWALAIASAVIHVVIA